MVSKEYIENKVSEYTMLSHLLKQGRIDKCIPWEDIEDRTRVYHDLQGDNNKNEFINWQLNAFLENYQRNLLQTQNKYLEIWIEKDALSSIFVKVAKPYTIPVIVCKGFTSVSFLNDYRERLKYQDNKKAVMLYFGDFDPSGIEMLEAMKITLSDDLGMNRIKYKRIALLKNDIMKYKLPHNPNALKKKDTRARKHLEIYGELAVELDSLRPDILEQKIKTAIDNELDIQIFNSEIRKYKEELNKLNKLKQKIKKVMGEA